MAKRVLIVDDSEMTRNIHSYIVKSAGYEIQTANNGYEALEILFQGNFDIVVTDINMPKMDGYKFIREVRKDEQFKKIPIVIISTESEAQDKTQGFDAGANVYIIKPVKAEELILNLKMLGA